eukprot:g6148.t1
MRMALERMGVFVVLKDGPTAIFFTICTIVLHLWLTAFLLADARPGLSTRQRLQLQVDDRLRETQWVLTVVIPGIMNAAVYICFAARCVGLMSGMVWTALLVGLFVVVAAGLYWFARMREQYDMMRRWEVIVLLVTCWLIAAYFPLEGLLRKAVPSLHVLVMRAADLGLMVALRHVVRSWLAAWLDEPRQKSKKAAVDAVVDMNRGFLTTINGGVAKIHGNQQELELRAGELQQQSAQFAKQTAQWLQAVEKFNATYQELGDVEQWTKGVEQELQAVATSLEYVSSIVRKEQ